MRRVALLTVLLAASLAAVAPGSAITGRTIVATVGPGPIFTLTNVRGATVRRLRPGPYVFVIQDRSIMRNFHLRGPGINRATPLRKARQFVWRVTLRKGVYRYFSDRYQGTMRGTFRVV